MCCGQKRSAMKANGVPHPTAVKLLYRGQQPISVRGSVTGQVYQFTARYSAQLVDPLDATAMTQTRLFKQIPWR